MSNITDPEVFDALLFDLKEVAYSLTTTDGVSNGTIRKINDVIDSLTTDFTNIEDI